jgi:hypothetical protein
VIIRRISVGFYSSRLQICAFKRTLNDEAKQMRLLSRLTGRLLRRWILRIELGEVGFPDGKSSQGPLELQMHSVQKIVDRQISRNDPICLGFGQWVPAIIAYYCPFPVKHSRRLEGMRFLLIDGVSSWQESSFPPLCVAAGREPLAGIGRKSVMQFTKSL